MSGIYTYLSLISSDPFERSMSLWIMKQYVLSAETLLEEASTTETDVSLSENEEDRKHAEKV